jgi:DNA-binding transcriptional ArsR family regulator
VAEDNAYAEEVGGEDADIAALANEIVRLRAAAARAQAEAERAAQKEKEAAAQLKAANARLLAALRGPRKTAGVPEGTPPRSGARWPLAPHATMRRAILLELLDMGVPMTPLELRKALPGTSTASLYSALDDLRRDGMIEKLRDGSYVITEAQQALMRAAANGSD